MQIFKRPLPISSQLNPVIHVTVGTFTETGNTTAFGIQQTNATVAYTLTGTATLFGRTLTSAVGTFTETGIAALFGRTLTIANGPYTLTGIAAGLSTSTFIQPVVGVFLLTGKNVILQTLSRKRNYGYIYR